MIDLAPDLERRFGGLRRLYGPAGYGRLRAARVAVVGLGGVGSWAAEALARSGVAALTLIDLDHVAESNINRQVQAVGQTIGLSKAVALGRRIADIHPGCRLHPVEEFVDDANWPALLPEPVDAVVDACDQARAKAVLAAWALQYKVPYVCSGAAGGKRHAWRIQVDDLAAATHDPLLAGLRQRLRARHGAPRTGPMGLRCVFSREPVAPPARPESADVAASATDGDVCDTAAVTDGTLNCQGYGSTVTVTAAFGLAAAGEAIEQMLRRPQTP